MTVNAKKTVETEQSVFNTLIGLIKSRNNSGYYWLELDQPKIIFNTKLNALFPNIFDNAVAIPVESSRKFNADAVPDRYGNFDGFRLLTVEQCRNGFFSPTMNQNFYETQGVKLTQFLAAQLDNNFVMFPSLNDNKLYKFNLKNSNQKVVMYIALKPLLRPDKKDDSVAGAETILREGLTPKLLSVDAKKILNGLTKKYLSEMITIDANGTIKTVRVLPKVNAQPVEQKPVEQKAPAIKLTDDEKALLCCDQRRFTYVAYEKDKLYDDGNGHWDIYDPAQANGANTYRTEKNFVARNPLLDVRRNGICAIDFGTKSTVVVCKDGNAQKIPLRIGTSQFNIELKDEQFENPTVEEFVDMKKFLSAYDEQLPIGRPHTEWEHFLISYAAQNDMKLHSKNLQKYYSFFAELKQWAAGQVDEPIIIDQTGEKLSVGNFNQPADGDIDLIELYAYYIGLNINNMKNGIWLKYKLSFPVSMKPDAAKKIRASFERGIKKSLPVVIQNSAVMKKFRVELTSSEPSAYAVCAMQEFAIEPEEGRSIFYGVFDFGGGTTDFDFGLWLESDDEKSDFGYELHRLCNKGDEYLGGENLLKLMAYETFKQNAQALKAGDVCFARPVFCELFQGYEAVLSNTRAARKNLYTLQEELRPFWEGESVEKDSAEKELDLISNNETSKNGVKIKIDYAALTELLKNRIASGIAQFEQRRQDAIKMIERQTGVEECMHIFLSGNSCKSKLVVDAFNERYKDEIANETIKIHPPLEARAVQNRIFSPNGKTGVAWGLLDINDSVKFVDTELGRSGKAEFKFYVGIGRKGKFIPKVAPDVEYGAWQKVMRANKDTLTIYYTDNFAAGDAALALDDAGMKYLLVEVDEPDDDKFLYIRAVDTDEIEFVVADEISINGGDEAQVVSMETDHKINVEGAVERRKLD